MISDNEITLIILFCSFLIDSNLEEYIFPHITVLEITVGHWTLSNQNVVNVRLKLQYVQT